MTHAVMKSKINSEFSVHMEETDYYFMENDIPVPPCIVPGDVRNELEPAAKKWCGKERKE